MQPDQDRLSCDYFSLSLDTTPVLMDLKLSWFLKQLIITDIKYVNNSKSRSIVFLKFLSPLRSYTSLSVVQNYGHKIYNFAFRVDSRNQKILVSVIAPTCVAMDKLL